MVLTKEQFDIRFALAEAAGGGGGIRVFENLEKK